MQFSQAVIVFEHEDWEDSVDKRPNSNVEIHDNGWVSSDVVEPDTGEDTVAYYSPAKVVAVFPE